MTVVADTQMVRFLASAAAQTIIPDPIYSVSVTAVARLTNVFLIMFPATCDQTRKGAGRGEHEHGQWAGL